MHLQGIWLKIEEVNGQEAADFHDKESTVHYLPISGGDIGRNCTVNAGEGRWLKMSFMPSHVVPVTMLPCCENEEGQWLLGKSLKELLGEAESAGGCHCFRHQVAKTVLKSRATPKELSCKFLSSLKTVA
jgi:hypothetical protein